MNYNIKEWIDLISRIAESIEESVIILDTSYEILYANHQASSDFLIDELSLTLEQVFSNESAIALTDQIGPAVFSGSRIKVNEIKLVTNTGISKRYGLVIDPINIEDERIIILIFYPLNKKNLFTAESLFSIQTISYQKIVENDVIKSLLEEIKKYLPLTIIGLKRIQALIDTYNFPIWLKDNQLKFIAANKAFSHQVNVDSSFIPGKKHETFLPEHLAKIFKSIDEFQSLSFNSVKLELFTENNSNKSAIRNIIQIPVNDNRSKLYLIVGLIYEETTTEKQVVEEEGQLYRLISNLTKPAALVNYDYLIEQTNTEFCKFFGKQNEDFRNKSFDEFFPYLISENIKSFIRGESSSDEFYINSNKEIVDRYNSTVKVSLVKIDDRQSLKILMIFDKGESINYSENELQNILMNRGKMFEVLIQNNPDPIFIYDKENLKFLEVNEAAIKFYGYSREEFLQMDLTDLYAPEDIQTLLDSFGEGSAEGKYSKPFRQRRKDGSSVVVEISKSSFRFKDKEAHFNIVKDITAEVEKEKQNQMLKMVFNSTDSLIFSTDASGFITYVNYPVIEKLGYTSNELLQSAFASLVIDEDRAIVNTTIFQPNLRDDVTLSTKIKKQDGDFLEAEIHASPLLDFNNELEAFTIIVKPVNYLITKEVPKEIIKEVVKEVIVEKPVKIQPSTQNQDANFFSGMFHEILTPMNVIIGFAQELLSGVENPTDEQREAAEIINQNRIKLMDTMNAVVEYSEIAQNKFKLDFEEVSITEIVDKLDKNIKEISGINEIQFSYGKISSSLKFRTDKQRFENLILLLIKVISRISKDKKVYFSAYPIDGDNFIIGINDQYNNSSDEVSNIFDLVFNESKDPKDFGLPKLSTYLAKVLLDLLGGRYQKTIFGLSRNESGFIFPANISIDTVDKSFRAEQDLQEEIQPEIESAKSDYFPETDLVKESSEETPESFEETTIPYTEYEEESDSFKPVTTISEELLSKIEEETSEIESNQKEDESEPEIIEEESQETAEILSPPSEETIENISEKIEETLVEREAEQTFIPPLPKLNLADLSCLYIEDQVDSQILFKVQMKGLKDVKFAVSFEESQSLLLKYQFDFIVIDINLQGEYNGLDALKIIRTMPALSNVPIIAVTAYVLPGDKEKFIAAGFDDFISKPIFREKMMESLEKIFLSKY